jgi:hypothetical protein
VTRLLVLVAVLFVSARADAYPWMVKHGYTSCQACHVDPGGAIGLTTYGRAQSDLLVRWHWDGPPQDEPSPLAFKMFGLFPMPEWIDPSANLRAGGLVAASLSDDAVSAVPAPLLMAADLALTLDFDRVVAYADVGFGVRRIFGITLFQFTEDPDYGALVSRRHWVGARFAEGAVFARAGRLQVPFGLHNLEHTSFVREHTRTDLNEHQQHGLSLAITGDAMRGEAMAILGNWQLYDPTQREYGYAGMFEIAPAPYVALGVSSLLTTTAEDYLYGGPSTRHAYGGHARWSPIQSLAILAEADVLLRHSVDATSVGAVFWLQGDWEPWQGVHFIPALEGRRLDDGFTDDALGAWVGASCNELPPTELRGDAIWRQKFSDTGSTSAAATFVAQFRVYL